MGVSLRIVEMVLAVREAIPAGGEMSEAERLMDLLTREYNAFVTHSAGVAALTKKVGVLGGDDGRWER